jgi:hypothetical protein
MSAWTVIGHTELSSAQANITFMNVGNIPNIYTDLYLVISGRNSNAVDDNEIVQLRFNSDSTSNYANRTLLGTGSGSAISQTLSSTYINVLRCPSNGRTSNTFSNMGIYIPNYTGSTFKSVIAEGVEENNATTAIQGISIGKWNSSSPITSITLNFGAGSFTANSSATLYGITRGSSGGVTVS